MNAIRGREGEGAGKLGDAEGLSANEYHARTRIIAGIGV